MPPVIRIDDQVMAELNKRAIRLGNAFVTQNDILRKVLELDVTVPVKPKENMKNINRGKKTPESAYRIPILEALYELGGSASVTDVLEVVERKMKQFLNEFDYQQVKSGEIRWSNTAKWERKTLVKKEGLLKSGSIKGIWELSDKGFQELRKKVV